MLVSPLRSAPSYIGLLIWALASVLLSWQSEHCRGSVRCSRATDKCRTEEPPLQPVHIWNSLVAIDADGDALRRVFANLLRNAIVHTPEDTPIEIGLEATEASAIVTVRDHGPGLPPGDPNAVFERFWRDSDSRGRDDGGAGLGLAIVAALVAAHGGTVDASNPADGGALFTVRLPLR